MDIYMVVVTDAPALSLVATEVMAEDKDDAKRVAFKQAKDRVVYVSKGEDFDEGSFGTDYKYYVHRLYEGDRSLDTHMWFNTRKAALESYAIALKAPRCRAFADPETSLAFSLQEQRRQKEPMDYCVRAFDIENRLWREEMCGTEGECLEKVKRFVGKYARYPVKAYKRGDPEEPDDWNVIFSTSGLMV